MVTDPGPAENVDHQAVGAAISTISSNLPEMAKGVKLIAALMEETHDDRLLDATRRLCAAFSDLLNAAQPENKEVRPSYPISFKDILPDIRNLITRFWQ